MRWHRELRAILDAKPPLSVRGLDWVNLNSAMRFYMLTYIRELRLTIRYLTLLGSLLVALLYAWIRFSAGVMTMIDKTLATLGLLAIIIITALAVRDAQQHFLAVSLLFLNEQDRETGFNARMQGMIVNRSTLQDKDTGLQMPGNAHASRKSIAQDRWLILWAPYLPYLILSIVGILGIAAIWILH